MNKSSKELLIEARSIAETEPDRAKKIFEDLANSAQHDVRSDAELELAVVAYKSWRLDEAAERAGAVLAPTAMASASAIAMAGVLLEVVHDFKDEGVDEDLLAASTTACIAVGESYMAAVGLGLRARLRLADGERELALRLLTQAEEQYEASGTVLGVPGVALRLAVLHAEERDYESADAALARGMAHLARFPYGGQSAKVLAQKLRAAAEGYAKRGNGQ